MNRWRLLIAGISLSALCACAAQLETSTPETAPSKQAANLSCAEINNTELVTIRYPAETIYRNGAVLPTKNGLACLEVLSDWLQNGPQNRWQVTVSGEEGYGFDPLALAGKRQEFLQRFFVRKGVEQKNWQWQTVVGQEEQVQFVELKDSP